MGRLSASLLALGLLAAVALSACGSGGGAKLLPGATAKQINANLDQVQELVGEEECIGAQDAAAAVGEQIEELEGVDAKLKQALSEGAERLNEVVAGCEEETGPSEAEEEAEEQEALEAVEAEEKAEAKSAKPAKEKSKPDKEVKEPKEEKEAPVEPEPPAQEEEGEVPPTETGVGAGAGGVGPGAPVGEG